MSTDNQSALLREALDLSKYAAAPFFRTPQRTRDVAGEVTSVQPTTAEWWTGLRELIEAIQPKLSVALAQAPAPSGEAPVAWWNGLREEDERDLSGPSYSQREDTWHDIPLYAGVNPCRLAATLPTPEQAGPSGEALKLVDAVERTLALVMREDSPGQATVADLIRQLRAALSSPGAMEGAQAAQPAKPMWKNWQTGQMTTDDDTAATWRALGFDVMALTHPPTGEPT